MPTIVSHSIQIDAAIFNEYKEQFATPYFSGSELLFLQTYYTVPLENRHRSNTTELFPQIAAQSENGAARYFEITGEFAYNVISASYVNEINNTYFNQ